MTNIIPDVIPTITNEENKSFNLSELINNDELKKYIGKNLDMNKISELINGNTTESISSIEEPSEKGCISQERREELRRRLRAKTNSLKGNRTSKEAREKNQINELKQNPLFQQSGNMNEEDVKNIIETYASKMTKDAKQKKNIKKQMKNLIEKMNTNEM
jgi:hypothetical protein